MQKKQTKQRIKKLQELINHHRYLYHVLDKQEISDSALDSLKKELFDLEQKFPEFITFDSPTQRVSGKPLKQFEKVRHPHRMLSFNDAFSGQDMSNWLERILKLLRLEEKKQIDFYCELKIDGLAVELIYENGILKQGSTRGDGTIGEDVTQNLKTIEAIPLKLEGPTLQFIGGSDPPIIVVARGEVFITKKEFEKINKTRKAEGLPVYANPRNIAAGSIRQLDPKVAANRNMDFFAYDLIAGGVKAKTHEEKHQALHKFGFKNNKYNKFCKNLDEVLIFRDYWIKNREKLNYEIDGIVVTINSNRVFEKLGVVGKAPRGAIAFKFPQAEATTKVLDVKLQVGRTGAVTPVAVLKPVQISGITVTRATLHNEDEIKRLKIKIGDTVIVGRAGDVIPNIIKVLPELRTGKEKLFKMPVFCPSCKTKLVKLKGEASLRCPNSKCFARKKRNFHHFVSRQAFNIDGLGPKIIDKLIDEGLVQDPSDLFELKEGDLVPLERFAEKSAENLVKAIQTKQKIDLPRFIYALGIRNVGEETAIDLAKKFGSLGKIKNSSQEDFDSVPDIGPIVSKSLYGWFSNKDNIRFLEKLERVIEISNFKFQISNSQKFSGKIFVLTGGLESMTRDDAKAKIRELSGDVSSSVSTKTDYVVAGSDPGSKAEKAKKLGVKIISEKEFLNLIG